MKNIKAMTNAEIRNEIIENRIAMRTASATAKMGLINRNHELMVALDSRH